MSWEAQIHISKSDDGWFHVYCPTRGESVDEARAAAEFILNALASGKLTMMRSNPEADEETDFDTKQVKISGFVRFSFRDEPGERKQPASFDDVVGFALPRVSSHE
jgi:hypothetical protein